MSDFDLIIRGGLVITAADTVRADIGIRNGRISTVAESLEPSPRTIDASGLLVMPGGVDSHCHIEQLRADGTVTRKPSSPASASAFAGGTTIALLPLRRNSRAKDHTDAGGIIGGVRPNP